VQVRVGDIRWSVGNAVAQPTTLGPDDPGRPIPGRSPMPPCKELDDPALPERGGPVAPWPVLGDVADEEQEACTRISDP